MNTQKILKEFERIRGLGYIKSNRLHNTGIGKTFEDYLGVNENNKQDPDFDGFEVKSHRELAKSKITLFTKSPSYPKSANSDLRNKYGEIDEHYNLIKKIHTSIFGNRFNSYLNKFGFKLEVDYLENKIYILVIDLNSNNLIEKEIYYSFEDIENSICKLKNLFIVYADTIIKRKKEHFHFTNAEIYLNFNITKFYKLIESGIIQYDIRIGTYKSGANFGKAHDHGSGFRISPQFINELYTQKIEIPKISD